MNSEATISIAGNKKLNITIDEYQYAGPGHSRLGNGLGKKIVEPLIDAQWELCVGSKAMHYAYCELESRIKVWKTRGVLCGNTLGIVEISRTTLERCTLKQWSAGIRELVKKDFVRKIAKGSYMLNPNFKIPANYEDALSYWRAL